MLNSKKRILTFLGWAFFSLLFVIGCSNQITTNYLPISDTTAPGVKLTISIAATLKDAMEEIKPLYSKHKSNVDLIYNFASSGTLQQQIEQGAPFDVFFSGGTQQMEALQQKGLLIDGTRKNLLKNQIVLIVSNNLTGINDFKDLANKRVKKIALGEPRSTAVGQFTEQALSKFSILDQVKAKAVYAKDVRQALRYVESGNTDAGIVFFPEAKSSHLVKLVQIVPETSHSPILLPIAVLKNSKNVNAAKEFIQFLSSDQAKAVFKKQGFELAGSSLWDDNNRVLGFWKDKSSLSIDFQETRGSS